MVYLWILNLRKKGLKREVQSPLLMFTVSGSPPTVRRICASVTLGPCPPVRSLTGRLRRVTLNPGHSVFCLVIRRANNHRYYSIMFSNWLLCCLNWTVNRHYIRPLYLLLYFLLTLLCLLSLVLFSSLLILLVLKSTKINFEGEPCLFSTSTINFVKSNKWGVAAGITSHRSKSISSSLEVQSCHTCRTSPGPQYSPRLEVPPLSQS